MCPTCNGHGLSSAALVAKTGFTFVVRSVVIVVFVTVVVALFIIIMIIVVGYFSHFYEFAWQHFNSQRRRCIFHVFRLTSVSSSVSAQQTGSLAQLLEHSNSPIATVRGKLERG